MSRSSIPEIRRPRTPPGNVLIADRQAPADRDINILLMGQSGIGKSTFINALPNYITHESLQDAEKHDIQVIIPASFMFCESDAFEDRMITVGTENEYEKFSETGQSATQMCMSYVFPIGNRRLRIIDTPGIGDTRGPKRDEANFQEVLNYIAQYDHLNAICILLKPNEERFNVLFRFCVNELLRHLHSDAKDNLIFLFTNGRATFYRPGESKRLLSNLLNEHHKNQGVEIPFNTDNTFVFDSEPFRYLAIRKNGLVLDEDQTQTYHKSWSHSVKEYNRFLARIVRCPLHRVRQMISLNEAEQIIRKLPRPIAETQRLIEQNIQMAQQYKQRVLDNPELVEEGIPQNMARVRFLTYPRTVCASERCRRITNVNGERRVEYTSICHEQCYLRGVVQETLADRKLEDCTAIDYKTGETTKDHHLSFFFTLFSFYSFRFLSPLWLLLARSYSYNL